MTEKDIYTHLKNGGTRQDLYEAFLKEVDAAQKKIDEDAEAEKIRAEKIKAKEKENKAKAQARKAAVDALTTYFSLVLPKHLVTKDINISELVEEALDSLEDTIKLWENIRIKW